MWPHNFVIGRKEIVKISFFDSKHSVPSTSFFLDNFFFCISNELKSVRTKYHISLIHDSWNCDSLSIWSNLKIDRRLFYCWNQDKTRHGIQIRLNFVIFLHVHHFLANQQWERKVWWVFFHILLLNSLLQGTYWRESTMLNDNNLDRKIY